MIIKGTYYRTKKYSKKPSNRRKTLKIINKGVKT